MTRFIILSFAFIFLKVNGFFAALPACSTVTPGTPCTSSGALKVGNPADIKAKCNALAEKCKTIQANAGDCEGKRADCIRKVDLNDFNPNGPKNTFGFDL